MAQTSAPAKRRAVFPLVTLFSTALFLSAGLMFGLQPMIGKMLLPLVGGTPAGWIVAMAFFQVALLLGYALAFFCARLPVRWHARAYLLLLIAGAAVLPLATGPAGGTETLDSLDTFLLLAGMAGLPFTALALSATTLQRLFAATPHPKAYDPYFLYTASNAGSMAGLLLYPLLVEPYLPLALQSHLWFVGYGILALMAFACCTVAGLRETHAVCSEKTAPTSLRQRLLWLALSFIPASLLMGITSAITRDVHAAPLLWVLPLAVYLFTFICAFRNPPLLKARWFHLPATAGLAGALLLSTVLVTPLRGSLLALPLYLLCLAAIALFFHLLLYEARPREGSDRHMASFYLHLAAGGALAGGFNAFLAPVLFTQPLELPLILLVAVLFLPGFRQPLIGWRGALCLLPLAFLMGGIFYIALTEHNPEAFLALLATAAALLALGHPRLLLVVGAAFFGLFLLVPGKNTLYEGRNFYGSLRIHEESRTGDEIHQARLLTHGTTMHGFQMLSPEEALAPTSYYAAVGAVFTALQPRDALVIGLGVGTMACLAPPHTRMTFIEIDPNVIMAARRYFSFLKGCPLQIPPQIMQGDGRIALQKMHGAVFDIIAIDVFSSDIIPAHMMTREALDLYLRHLSPDGVILFHISNMYFDLGPVIARLAKDARLSALQRTDAPLKSHLESESAWLALARRPAPLARFAADHWTPLPPPQPGQRLWTDDHASLLDALRPGLFQPSWDIFSHIPGILRALLTRWTTDHHDEKESFKK